MSIVNHWSVLLLAVVVLVTPVIGNFSPVTETIIYRTCMLNKHTAIWSSVSDCAAFAAFSTDWTVDDTVPRCMFSHILVGSDRHLNIIATTRRTTAYYCDLVDAEPQILPVEVINATYLTSIKAHGPQPELSGQDLTTVPLQQLEFRNVSFTEEPLWPPVNSVSYYGYDQNVMLPVPPMSNNLTGSYYFYDSWYYYDSITVDAMTVTMYNCTFAADHTTITNMVSPGAVKFIDSTVLGDLVIVGADSVSLINTYVTGSLYATGRRLIMKQTDVQNVDVDMQYLFMIDVSLMEIIVASNVRYMYFINVTGTLVDLHFTNELVGLYMQDCPELSGQVQFPEELLAIALTDLPPISDADFSYIAYHKIIIRRTQISGTITYPDNLMQMIITYSKFVGAVPDYDDYPDSLIYIDLRNNYLDLCTGYPAMGPKIPQSIGADDVLLYPQYANVTCYCVAGNCLVGNGFPAHYQGAPALYQSIDCISTAPLAGSYCLIGFWSITSNYTVAQGETLNAGTGLAVQGDLTVEADATVTYELSDKPILVQGDVEIDPTAVITVNMGEEVLTNLRGKEDHATVTVPLIRTDGALVGDITNLRYNAQASGRNCNKVSGAALTTVKGSLAAIMTIDGSQCKGAGQWSKATIIGVTVGIVCGVAVLVIIVMLLVTYHPKIRQIIRPFTRRRSSPMLPEAYNCPPQTQTQTV